MSIGTNEETAEQQCRPARKSVVSMFGAIGHYPSLDETGGLVMATHIPEALLQDDTGGTLQEQKERNREADQVSGVMLAAAIPLERRYDVRMDYRCRCSYEVVEAIDEELAFIKQGEAFALNRSVGGMLLIMGHALQVTQLIEVHTSHSRWGRAANVYEIRWDRPIEVESLGNLYLVGCRRIFGPCHYLSF
jgi:hypothetical protein